MASEWLGDLWGEQRHIRSSHVKRLAADMDAGTFKVSPDAILLVKDKLANGQHRLSAIVQSGKTQAMIVMKSNDEELYKVLDAGIKRQERDALIGLKYSAVLPSVAKWVYSYEIGSARLAGPDLRLTRVQIIDYCISNKELLSDAVSFVYPLYEQTRLLPTSIAGALYVISDANGMMDKAKEFLNDVYLNGGQSAAGDLRNRLIGSRTNKVSKIQQGYVFAIAIKALKSFANGTRPGVLKWAPSEALPKLN